MMRRYMEWRGLALVTVTLAVVLLTTLPRRFPGMRRLFRWLGYIQFGDKIGHAALFGALVAVGYVALRGRLSPFRALLVAAGGALLLGAGTELYQDFVSGRSATWSDLAANWLGIAAAALLIGACQAAKEWSAPARRRCATDR